MARKLYEAGGVIPGWIAANLLGVAAIGVLGLAFSFLKPIPGMLASSLLIGIPIGFAQWVALRRVAPISILWVLTIFAGLFLGLVALTSPIPILPLGFLDDESVLALTAGYTTIAFFIGVAQWLLLRGHFTRSWVWMLSSAVGLGLGTGLVLVSDLIYQSGLVSIILVTLVYAIVTGPVIAWLQASQRKTGSNPTPSGE